jgi:hypothetical protein
MFATPIYPNGGTSPTTVQQLTHAAASHGDPVRQTVAFTGVGNLVPYLVILAVVLIVLGIALLAIRYNS